MIAATQPATGANVALDELRSRAVRDVKIRGLTRRRPSWAPFIALSDELASVLRQLGWLAPDAEPLGRLWANFTMPNDGAVECKGFALRAGRERSGKCFYEATALRDGWLAGPCWTYRGTPVSRATELGAAATLSFAGAADAQMKLGGVLAKACGCCGRTLTDTISLEYGIGPECRAQFVGPGPLLPAGAE